MITRQAGRALLGISVPEDGNFQLEGTLVEVRKATSGTTLTAVFEIAGDLDLAEGKGAIKARVEFAFATPPATSPPAATAPAPAATAKRAASRGTVMRAARSPR